MWRHVLLLWLLLYSRQIGSIAAASQRNAQTCATCVGTVLHEEGFGGGLPADSAVHDFPNSIKCSLDTLVLGIVFRMMKINTFWGDLTGSSG